MGKTMIATLILTSLFGCKTTDVDTNCPNFLPRKMDIKAERISTVPEKLELSEVMDTIAFSKKHAITD